MQTKLGIPQKYMKRFETAISRLGFWPITVWELDSANKQLRYLKKMVGENISTRINALQLNSFSDKNTYQVSASKFQPAIAVYLYRLYAPDDAIVYDPFAGGGVRALIASKKGLGYIGVELREDEVREINKLLKREDAQKNIHIICGDSQDVSGIEDNSCNFLLTCPPYYNLEKYHGGSNDLSMARTYDDFLDGVTRVIQESRRILKPGSISCWVVGLIRDEEKSLIPLHHDVAWLHYQAGFKLKEEIILYKKNTGAVRRVGKFMKGNKLLVRVHEYCLVFRL